MHAVQTKLITIFLLQLLLLVGFCVNQLIFTCY